MLLPRLMSKGDVLLVFLVSIIARIISDYNSILFKALMKWPSRFRLFPPLPPPTPPPISFSPLASSVPLFYVCTFLAIVQVHFNNDQLDNVMQMPVSKHCLKSCSGVKFKKKSIPHATFLGVGFLPVQNNRLRVSIKCPRAWTPSHDVLSRCLKRNCSILKLK